MATDSRSKGVLLGGGLLLAAVLAIAVGERWLELVVVLQSGPVAALPSADIQGDYLTGVFWAIVLSAGVLLWGTVVRLQGPLLMVWLAKATIVLGPMLFYDHTYGVDPDGFFNNASSPGFQWQGLQIGQGTQNTQMLAWLHFHWISSSFHASRLTFALVGLVGAFLVYRAGVICLGREDRRLFYAFALMPSVLFWSSTLGKDPITMFGVAAYAYGVVAWHTLGKSRYLLWVVVGLAVCVYIRVWLGPILLIPLAALGWMRAEGVLRRATFLVLGLSGIIAAPLVLQFALGVDVLQQDQFLGTADDLSRSFIAGGSTLEVPELSTFGGLASFAPFGMFTVLFRPFVGEVPNLFGSLAGLENALLLFLVARAVWRSNLRDLKEPLVAWAITGVILWAAVYAVNSFQNLGTAARHRLHIMPLLIGVLFYLGRQRSGAQPLQSSTGIPSHPSAAMRPGI